ncbi:MAG: hypothetical protein U5R14_08190 [Gemmatimonadota bacterium]|nr:hypothetical protein [Gemmatimonadota bacterium]
MTLGRCGASRLMSACAVCLALLMAEAVSAQTPGQLRGRCVELGGNLNRCTDVAVGARTLTGEGSLLVGWGSEIAGSSSTLGRRIGNQPRFTAAFRAGGMSVGMPDIFDQGPGRAPEVSFMVPSLNLAVAAGILDGFSPLATVGGVFSLDVFGSAGLVMPPSSQGFQGNVTGASVGVRVGLLRESFTLPGVSVSVARRFVGSFEMGDPSLGDPARLEVDPAVTSLRATVGKDLFGLGVLAGVGWEDAAADAVLEVPGAGGESVRVSSSVDAERKLYFVGAALNFLLLQLSVEGGWADGYAPVPGGAGSTFDPEEGTPFGSLSLRFTP